MKSDHVKAFIFFRATIRLYLEMYYEIARAVLPSTRPDKRTPGVRHNADKVFPFDRYRGFHVIRNQTFQWVV
jgi:hypothetical protein